MKPRILFYTFFIFLLSSSVLLAQSTEEDSTADPFKNDPFFSKPIEDFFKRSSVRNQTSDNEDFHYYVGRLNDNGLDYEGALEAGPYNSGPLYGLYPNLPMIHYNRVNGLFLGIREERMQWHNHDNFLGIPSVRPHGLIGYSFGQKEWQYTVGLDKFLGAKKHVIIGGEYHNATSTDDYWRVGLNETSVTSFFAGYDYLDYYKQRGWGMYVLKRTDRLFEGGIAYNQDRFNSLDRETDWALFGSGSRFRDNPPIELISGLPVDTLNVSSLVFSASFNPKRLLLSNHFTFSLAGTVEIGDPGFGDSDYSYTKYLAELTSYINFEPGGVLKYRLKMGSITGDAPLMKEFQLGGPGSLRALPYKSVPLAGLGGNQLILSNAEIHFGSPSFGSSDWIDFDDFYLSLFLDSGWAAFSEDLSEGENPLKGFSDFSFSDLRHSAGIGIGSSLIRCELAWDLNNTSRAPVFWLRFNPTF